MRKTERSAPAGQTASGVDASEYNRTWNHPLLYGNIPIQWLHQNAMSIARRQHSLLCTAVWHGNAAAVYHHHMKEWQKARMTPLNGYWPWPCLIAHRGAGTLAPENTLAAMRTGQAHGLRMMEYDVRLTRDGIPVLLHDDTLNRTSNGRGHLAEHSLDALLKLDFGAWHSAAYAGEPIPTLYSIAAYTLANGLHSNIEIKAACGTEAETGTII